MSEATAKPSAFPGVDKRAIFMFNPFQLAIMGGKDTLPEDERGPLDTVTDKESPLYDERLKTQKLTPEFKANVKVNGVRETVNVVKIGETPFIVNGRRRVRAARAADKDGSVLVPCQLVKLDDVGMIREMIITNLHEDDSVHVKIQKLKRLIAMGVTPEDAAVVFATRPATVKAWLQYDATAIPAVKKAVASGKIPQSTGADIARLGDETKQEKALAKVLDSGVSSNPGRKERKGNAAKAKRAIAEAGGKWTGISDKKTLKKLLAMVADAPKKGDKPETVAWWRGVAEGISVAVTGDLPDERLMRLIKSLDSEPPAKVVATPEGKKANKGKKDATPAAATTETPAAPASEPTDEE